VSRRRERGVVLLAAVTALALMSAMAVGVARVSAIDQRFTWRALAALQADALARSGIAVAAVVLGETNAGDAPDTLRSPWARDAGRQRLGPGWVEVGVEDAGRRLDLGAPELADALPRLLALLGLDAGLADAIADWVDADDAPRPRGAERDWYLARTPPRLPRNGACATLGELTLVRGVDAGVLRRLAPHVTVAGEHAINPNTASREVLLAVVQDVGAVERLLAARARGPIADADVPDVLGEAPAAVRDALRTRSQHYLVHARAEVGEVQRAVEATLWAPGGLAPEVVAWQPLQADERRASVPDTVRRGTLAP